MTDDRYVHPLSTGAHSGVACAHCGHEALGYATVTDPSGQSVRVCHHEKRDCYNLVTVWGATLGENWHSPGGAS